MTSLAHAQTTDVALGIEALARRDVKGADAAFARGTTSDNPLIRPAAWQWRGHVAWKFRGDMPAAARYLDSALAGARDSSQILLEVARLAGARRRYRDAVRIAFDAMSRSVDAERRGLAARTLIELAVDGAFAARSTLLRDSVDSRTLSIVRDTMGSRVRRFPGRTTDASALIDAAAMLGDSTAVRAGLRSYFALHDDALNPSWFSDSTLVEALRRGRLFESAALYLRGIEADLLPPEWVDLIAYAGFLHDMRSATAAVYRAELVGTARVGDINRALNARGRRLWSELQWGGRAPEFYPADLYRALASRFGARITIERTRAVDELYLGHWLSASPINGGAIVMLEGTVESGIDNWLLDGTGGRAAWVAIDTVYARRTAFTETPFRALVALTDPQTIPGELFRIARDSIGDVERARRDSLGYFPGVAGRIIREGAAALLDSVREPAMFTRAFYQNLTRTSILLHESRHVADARAHRPSTPADDEFRAKLDEVTGAALPRLALTAILSPNIGDSSSHGMANRRIMIGLNRWIRRNGARVAKYDATTPALLQLPNLTDAQLRAAFRSMRVP